MKPMLNHPIIVLPSLRKSPLVGRVTSGCVVAALIVVISLSAIAAGHDLTNDSCTGQPGKFAAGYCITWHRVGGEGGHSGPDLGSLVNRLSIRDILVAICEPSASVSDQYLASVVKLKDGDTLNGRLIFRNDKEVGITSSQVSMMPAESLSCMNRDELMDLMALSALRRKLGSQDFQQVNRASLSQ